MAIDLKRIEIKSDGMDTFYTVSRKIVLILDIF